MNATNIKQIDVPSFSGSFGILPNHVPILAVLKPGVLTVFEEGENPKKYFGMVYSHFMHIWLIVKP